MQLDLKVHVGSLLLRALPSAVAEAYVSLQLFDGGLPMHSSPRCTSVGVPGAGGTITWDEWVTLPVRIRDLTLAAVIIARVWTSAGCVAGSTVRVFDARSALKRGRQSVTVWRRGADVDEALRAADAAAVVGAAGDESAALALVARADAMAPLRSLISRIASRDVPECPWTDRLLWAQVQVELLADVRLFFALRAAGHTHFRQYATRGVFKNAKVFCCALTPLRRLYRPLFPTVSRARRRRAERGCARDARAR